jgi:hypothetical protein
VVESFLPLLVAIFNDQNDFFQTRNEDRANKICDLQRTSATQKNVRPQQRTLRNLFKPTCKDKG